MKKVILVLLVLTAPLLLAFRQVLPPEVEQVIVYVLALVVGWFGPNFLELLYATLGLSGVWAVVATHAIALGLGALAVYAASVFLGLALPTDFWGLAFIILTASQVAFNRLKDKGAIKHN